MSIQRLQLVHLLVPVGGGVARHRGPLYGGGGTGEGSLRVREGISQSVGDADLGGWVFCFALGNLFITVALPPRRL